MEEQVITVTIRTKGDVCVLSNEEIAKWYKENIEKLFNNNKRFNKNTDTGVP